MRHAFAALAVALGSLVALGSAAAAHKDAGADVTVAASGAGQYTIQVQNTGDLVLNSFTFVPGPGLAVHGVTSTTAGTCQLAGPNVSCTGLSVLPGNCACAPAVPIVIIVTGSGEPAGGSIVQAAGSQVPVTAVPKTSVAQVAKATTTTTKPKAKPKAKAKVPACKKGQRSTKKKPCRK